MTRTRTRIGKSWPALRPLVLLLAMPLLGGETRAETKKDEVALDTAAHPGDGLDQVAGLTADLIAGRQTVEH